MKTLLKISAVLIAFAALTVWAIGPGLRWHLRPAENFTEANTGTPPDYSTLEFWASHPGRADAADLAPEGFETVSADAALADVFYIHPTTYFGPGGWNAPISDEQFAAQGVEHVLATQASVFSDCCRIFAPNYRQAHLSSFINRETDSGLKALDLAFGDVEEAFRYYIEHENRGRPFIIAAHSQGTAHALRLLHTRVEGTDLQKQLVGAYLIGYWVPTDVTERLFDNLDVCADAEEHGCFVTYDTYDESGPGRLPDTGVPHWYEGGWEWSDNKASICVNPLNWKPDRKLVGREYNKGAVPMKERISLLDLVLNRNSGIRYSELGPVMDRQTSAVCREDGPLMIESQVDNPFSEPGSGEDRSYHVFDWNFFYVNIRENAKQRIASHQKAQGLRTIKD